MLAFVAAMFLSIIPLRAQQDSVTDCPLITAHPWYVDFDTDFDCWLAVGDYDWTKYNLYNNTGIRGSSSGHSMIASPAVALPADSTGLRLYWSDVQTSNTFTYYVLVSRGERMNLDDYDTLFTSMPGNGSFVQRSVSLADYAGDTVYIAFHQKYQRYKGRAGIFHVAMYNSVVPIGSLAATSDAVAIGDTVRYAVHLTQAGDSLLTFSWHSTLLDTTFITSDSTLALVYTVTGSDTLTVTVSNAYGTLVLQSGSVGVYDCSSLGVIPWEEDFSYDGRVACWVENGFNRRTDSLSFGYEDGSRGSFVNLMYAQTAGGYLLTRPITVPVDADNLALMVEFSGGLDVRISPTASTDTASYTDHLLSEPYVANRMKSRWVNLASYAGQTIRVGLFRSSSQLYINQLVLDYVAHPLVILTAQEKTTTDSATLFVASLRHGSTEGLHYAWHSAAGGTIATNAVGDSAWITYGTAVLGDVDTVRVIATNDYGTDTTYKAIRIVDCTPATTLPWVETFADGIVCWYKPEGSNFISDRPYSYSTDPYFERYRYLKSTCDSDTADHWIVSKAIVVPSDTSQEVVLEWKVGSSNTNFVHTYQVLATSSDDFTDTSLYIPLYFDSSAHGSYLRYDNRAVSLRQFAGQTINIAFRNRPVNYVGTNVDLLFDDITVRTTCVPVVNLTADNSTYYYGDTATFTATFVEGNPDGLTYTWLSTLLDTTIVGDNTLSLCYGLQDGYDTITVIATNAYGSDTAFVVVTSQIIMQPSVVYFSADGMAFFLEKDHAEVGDTLHYVFVRNRCVTTGLTYSLHSSLLDTTITLAAVGDTCRITLVYTAAGNDSLTAEVANVYGAGTAMRYLAVRDCPAVGVPFCETFDSIETLYNGLLPCWPGWWVLTTSHMVGSSAQSHLHRYLISPAIDLPADTCGLQLSWYTAATTGTTIPVRILVSPTGGKRVEDFTDTLFSRQIVNYTDNSVSLDAYLGQRIRVAFTNYGYMFDNIRVDYDRSVPLVPQPTIEGSATAHLFDDNVYVASLVSGCPQGTTYNWCSSMAAGGLATLTVNGDTVEVRYLALGSDTLRCIATNSFGSDTAVAVVRVIDCSARAVPYYMDFESVTATDWNVVGEIPDCWHSFYDGSTAGNAPHVIDSCPYYGLRDIPDNALFMSGEDFYVSESEVILPCFTDSLQNLLMALDYRYESANKGILTVGYRGADGIFNVVDTLPGYSGSYRRHIVSFADATVPDAQIVLRWQAGTQWSVVIDNIEVFRNGGMYDLRLFSADTAMGTVSGSGEYADGDTAVITATPAEGYHFVMWNDSVDANPRAVVMTSDTSFTAYFAPDTVWRRISVASADTLTGTVSGGGVYVDGDTAVITATPAEGYKFVMWNDSIDANPRAVVMTSDTSFTAYFAPDTVWHTVTIHAQWMEGWEGAAEELDAYVAGAGTYREGDTVTLSADSFSPKCPASLYGWVFVPGDTIMENPYSFVITSDTVVTAVYTQGVGITDVVGASFALYPNPASTEVMLDCGGDAEAIFIDLHGREVLRTRCREGKNRIDIGSLPAGVYYVRLAATSASATLKLVIQ